MYLKCSLFILVSCLLLLTYQWQNFKNSAYKMNRNADYIYTRIFQVMRAVQHRGKRRQMALDRIRFYYEKTPHYEMGYIMGEIIERYRKMVNHERRLTSFKSTPVHFLVKKVQTVQHLFFEIIHLVAMMHEIELKYISDPRFTNIFGKKGEDDKYNSAKSYMNPKDRDKYKKQKIKESKNELKKKRHEAELSGTWAKYSKPTRRPNYWTIEYGWDIGPVWR